MLIALALLGSALGADCAAPTSPTEMETHIDDALLAFATLDEEGVYAAADQASHDLECMGAVLGSGDAAAYHRLVGIRTFMEGNSDAALVSFQAARAIEPDYRLSTKIAPEGGKLARLWESAGTTPDQLTVTFKVPPGMTAHVDGQESNQYSLEFPAVVQYVASNGHVAWSGYLRPGDKPPKDLAASSVAVAPAPAPAPVAPAPEPDVADLPEADEEEVVIDLTPAPEPEAEDLDEIVDLDEPEVVEPEPEARKPRKEKPEPMPMDYGPAEPEPRERKGGLSPVWAATIGTGAASVAAFGLSAGMRASFDAEPTAAKFHVTNGAFYTSMGLVAATAGLAITGFVVEF